MGMHTYIHIYIIYIHIIYIDTHTLKIKKKKSINQAVFGLYKTWTPVQELDL